MSTAHPRGPRRALCPLEPSCGNWVFIRMVWSPGPGPVLPRDGERLSLGRNPALGSWVQAHFSADTCVPHPRPSLQGPSGSTPCCCCPEILNRPARLSAPSSGHPAVSALNSRGGRPGPCHSGLLLGSVLLLSGACSPAGSSCPRCHSFSISRPGRGGGVLGVPSPWALTGAPVGRWGTRPCHVWMLLASGVWSHGGRFQNPRAPGWCRLTGDSRAQETPGLAHPLAGKPGLGWWCSLQAGGAGPGVGPPGGGGS